RDNRKDVERERRRTRVRDDRGERGKGRVAVAAQILGYNDREEGEDEAVEFNS
ncbi:conserved hypothetical protein, partial [Ricinus communis]